MFSEGKIALYWFELCKHEGSKKQFCVERGSSSQNTIRSSNANTKPVGWDASWMLHPTSFTKSNERSSIMNVTFNQDVLAGKWEQARGKVKQWWGKITDNDLERISGRIDQLIGVVQERYGYTREQAEKEVTKFVDQFNKQ